MSASTAARPISIAHPADSDGPESDRPVTGERAERWLTLLAGAGAALPVIVSTVRAINEHWTPFGDRAVIATRAFDVFTLHSPLVGQYSAWSTILTHPIYSPGPLLYWLLAVPARWLGGSAFPIWVGAVNAACVVGIVILARRRGGHVLMFAAAIAVLLVMRSLPAENLHDPWDPSSPLLPLTLLLFLAWSVACGEYRLLPITVLVASFAVETHLAFLMPALGVLIIASVGLAASRGWIPTWLPARLRPVAGASPAPSAPAPSMRPWVWGAVAIAGICWVLPVLQQIFRPPGNLFLIAKAVLTRGGTLGSAAGWHAFAHTTGIPPWWLRMPIAFFRRLVEVVGTPSAVTEVSAVLILLAALATLWVALRRGRDDIASAATIAFVLPVSVGLGTASTPTAGLLGITIGYTLWWASPAGMFAWLLLGWGGLQLMSDRWSAISAARSAARSAPRLPSWAGVLTGLVAVAAMAIAVSGAQSADTDSGNYRPFRIVMASLDAALPHPGRVLVTQSETVGSFELGSAVIYELRRRGNQVMVPARDATVFGGWYVEGHRRYDAHVLVAFDQPAPGRVIARIRVGAPAASIGTYTVSLAPGGGG